MKNMNNLVKFSLALAVLSGHAGDLIIEGDLNVTSNLTSRSLSVTNAAVLSGPLIVSGKRMLVGANASTSNDNTFVWSDGTVFGNTTSNQFNAFASSGFRLLGGPIQGNGSGLTGLIVSNVVAGSIGSSALASNSVTAAKFAVGSVGTAVLASNSVTAAILAAGSVGTNKALIVEWNAWGNGRYLSLTGSSDLILNPGRIVAGFGLNLTNIASDACGASQQGWSDGGTQTIGEWAVGASQVGYNYGLQTIGAVAVGASQRGCNCGDQIIGADCYGVSQQGYNWCSQTVADETYGASQQGENYGIQSIGYYSHGASQQGQNGGDQNIGVFAYGASQQGGNCGAQSIGYDASGASQLGCNNGTQVIGDSAYGAEQRGYLAPSSFATNNGIGSIQLLNLTNSQTALITGSASIGLGACKVTNDQAIVAGDGLFSRGRGSVTAVRFFGDGSGLTNLNLSAAVPTNSVTTDKLAGNSVTAVKLADGSVTSVKIQDGTIVDADIATAAAIAQSKVSGLTAAVGSLNTHLSAVNNPHGVTAAQIGAYTSNQIAAAISQAIAGSDLNKCVRTNHTGAVAIDGALSAQAFAGNGFSITNLNLAAYVGSNLSWDTVSNKLNATMGSVDSNVVSAVRVALQLGSAATNNATAFAPADLSAYASGTVIYSNGHFHAAAQLSPMAVTNAALAAWQNLDTDKTDDLTRAGGTLTGDLNMGETHRVTGLASPQTDSDAVSKGYLRLVLSNLKPQGNLSMGAYTNGAPAVFPLEF